MNVKNQHVFTTQNLEPFDYTMLLIYRGFSIWQFRQLKVKRCEVIYNAIYANKIVYRYLRGV